jgi:hypothetical protein
MVTRKVRNLFLLVVCSISFRLVAQAQDTSYSTDSLMAAFDKGSQTSLKGSEITLTGVIVEIKKSRSFLTVWETTRSSAHWLRLSQLKDIQLGVP